ncbi:oligosaccharide flippase family protein [Dokdonia sp. Asnod1-B02]|uniref:oligosaccharide flippase family protein n=1 Tax=Dokdonia sp. Asnod1-B02 TaxID=3160573 RepID=UPI003865DA99
MKNLQEIKTLMNSSFGKRISINYISLLLIQVTNLVLPIVTFPYLISVLGLEKFGLIMFAQAVCSVLYIFVDYGFSLSATRRITLQRTNKEEMAIVFSTVLLIKIAIATSVFILYSLAVFIVPKFQVEKEVFLLSYLMVVGQACFVDWFFQGIEKMKVMALLSLLAKGVFTLLIFVFIRDVSHYVQVPFFMGIGYILAGILSVILALKYVSIVRPSLTLAKELLMESFSLFISNLAARLINTIPILILGFFVNDFTVAIYTSMEKLITTSKGVFVSLYQALFPWLVTQTRLKQRAYVKKMIPIVGLLAIIITLPFLICGGWLLNILYDNVAINENSYLFYILALNIIFTSYFMLFIAHYFPAVGDFMSRLKTLAFSALCGIILGLIFISQLEILGAVITAVSIEAILLIFSIYYFIKTRPVGTI